VLVTCRSANNQWKIASGYFLAACIYDPTFNANKNYLATLTRKTIAKGLAINEMLAELQKHFDFLDAHVQLFLFDNEHGRKAIFIGDRRRSHQSAIGVYYDKMNRQVYAVDHLSKMFGNGHSSEFCPMTGEIFNVYTPEHHICEARCVGCGRHGYNYPCEKNLPKMTCDKCQQSFYNESCYNFHKEDRYGRVGTRPANLNCRTRCERYRKCLDCEKTYFVPRNIHRCSIQQRGGNNSPIRVKIEVEDNEYE